MGRKENGVCKEREGNKKGDMMMGKFIDAPRRGRRARP